MVCDPLDLIKVSTSHTYLGLNLSEMKIWKSSRHGQGFGLTLFRGPSRCMVLILEVKLRDPLNTVKITAS